MPEQTVAHAAIREAAGKHSPTDKLLYTGRMLVKQACEDFLLSDPVDPEEAVQYLAPEIRFWAKPLVKFAIAGFKDRRSSQKLLLNRILVINNMAGDQPEAISIFDQNGRVES